MNIEERKKTVIQSGTSCVWFYFLGNVKDKHGGAQWQSWGST